MSHRATYKLKSLELIGTDKLGVLAEAMKKMDLSFYAEGKSAFKVHIKRCEMKLSIDDEGCVQVSGRDIHEVRADIEKLCQTANCLFIRQELRRKGFIVQKESELEAGRIELVATRM